MPEKILGHEGGDEVAADGFGVFVEEEDAAIGIAVEADAQVGLGLVDLVLEEGEVGLDERVGLVGEAAGDFEEDLHDLQAALHFAEDGRGSFCRPCRSRRR